MSRVGFDQRLGILRCLRPMLGADLKPNQIEICRQLVRIQFYGAPVSVARIHRLLLVLATGAQRIPCRREVRGGPDGDPQQPFRFAPVFRIHSLHGQGPRFRRGSGQRRGPIRLRPRVCGVEGQRGEFRAEIETFQRKLYRARYITREHSPQYARHRQILGDGPHVNSLLSCQGLRQRRGARTDALDHYPHRWRLAIFHDDLTPHEICRGSRLAGQPKDHCDRREDPAVSHRKARHESAPRSHLSRARGQL